ncbi:hypothetical protein ERJ75_000261800 [Trypanosoma vivax]|uniref:Uncharacterized protein n=1 Tax=Trypanosoma vivax (strain Y486) TaxID=1055687 RepID=F9WRY3_TRYVY|nr:hypothetical protein ERJ75_000863400 [Trypanosoma vivax]KAH8616687.1 hypothetical protein ERJ75_000455000 [Trypanosoma vivax]KAH8618554.1 hypothetical protein ERJ75_000261800 [Trypanosoma vivax]CCD20319.1 hypothetical protein, conserved in T.vivax [Trypanosoma vivax Y486]|eukprot:CCD20319.1 hypothetical protein, conserved in T.vivax [Trypanosoma vivax Y486]
MFKLFFLCTAAWCVFCFATANGQVTEDKDKNIHKQITIDCAETEDYKFNVGLAKPVGKYNFSCFKDSPTTIVGLSVEGSRTRKKLSGLGGSRAWCTFDGKVHNESFECTPRMARSMLNIPKKSCTVWEQENSVSWFSALVVDGQSVTCSVSGIYGDLMYSFRTERPSGQLNGHNNITLNVTIFAAKGFLPPDLKPLPTPVSPTSKAELAPANKNKKQSGASWNVAQPQKWDKDSRGTPVESAGKGKSEAAGLAGDRSSTKPEAKSSRDHANAAAVLSLPLLLSRQFSA